MSHFTLFRKRLGSPKTGNQRFRFFSLVHGSSVSSRPSFDLTVPGHGEYSVMNTFAQYGFDVWTMDHETTVDPAAPTAIPISPAV